MLPLIHCWNLDGCHLSTETQKQPMLFSSLAKNPGCRIHHVMVETLRLLEKMDFAILGTYEESFFASLSRIRDCNSLLPKQQTHE
jgi:hypothetical protein